MAGLDLTHKGPFWTAHERHHLLNAPQEEHLTKILFTKAHALCHDINYFTKAHNHIDIIMGFSTGDIIWYEPMSQKYTRLNKNVSEHGLTVGRGLRSLCRA